MRTPILKSLIGLLLLVIFSWLIRPLPASALGVTPGELNFRMDPGSQCTRNFQVINDRAQAINCRIYVDEPYKDWFSISPEEVLIFPQNSSEIEITVAPPLTTIGKREVPIYITSSQPSSGLRIAYGIKLRANITVDIPGYIQRHAGNLLSALIVTGGGIILLGVMAFFILQPMRKGR